MCIGPVDSMANASIIGCRGDIEATRGHWCWVHDGYGDGLIASIRVPGPSKVVRVDEESNEWSDQAPIWTTMMSIPRVQTQGKSNKHRQRENSIANCEGRLAWWLPWIVKVLLMWRVSQSVLLFTQGHLCLCSIVWLVYELVYVHACFQYCGMSNYLRVPAFIACFVCFIASVVCCAFFCSCSGIWFINNFF